MARVATRSEGRHRSQAACPGRGRAEWYRFVSSCPAEHRSVFRCNGAEAGRFLDL